MMKRYVEQLGKALFAILLSASVTTSAAQAGSLQDEFHLMNTCGTHQNQGQCKFAQVETAATGAKGHDVSSRTSPVKLASATTDAGDPAGNTLFIIDASGSMWGRIDGKPKITVAKDVLGKLVVEIPDKDRIGLIAYGHRRRGDCNDVETLVSLDRNNKRSVLSAVRGLNAKGKTPLTRSVNQAVEMLRSKRTASTVVLVSDGIESCGGDPCAAVKAAKAAGVKFILHTVGFGLSKEESAQLQCMAKAGGGKYFHANNAEELLKSVRKAVKSKGPGNLKLTMRANGKPVNAWARITDSGTHEVVVLTNDEGAKPGQSWALEPGTYRLETYPADLRGVTPLVLKDLKIEAGKTVEKSPEFAEAILRLSATDNGKPVAVHIRLRNADTGVMAFDSETFSTFTMHGVKTPYDVHLQPGRYHLLVKTNAPGVRPYEEDVELPADRSPLRKSVSFDLGKLRVLVSMDGKPVRAEVRIADASAQKTVFKTMPYVGDNTPLTVSLAPGTYNLVARPAGVAGVSPKIVSGIKVTVASSKDVSLAFNSPKVVTDTNGMEQNTDRPAGDYQSFLPAADNPSLCQTACGHDAQCKAWTYVKPNTVQGPQPHCYLKNSVPPAVPNTCCTSGVKK